MNPVPPKRVLFFGDSITELGAKPGGYIDLIQKELSRQGRSADYELLGVGIGGNKV
jgi:23S rRNA U2552 (ribose-2'-O)-methylase RlmE/FtsJ